MKPRILTNLVYADRYLEICAKHCRAGAKQTLAPKRVSALVHHYEHTNDDMLLRRSRPFGYVSSQWVDCDHVKHQKFPKYGG